MQRSPAVEVRRARREEAGVVARLLAEAFADLRPHYTPAAYAATTPGEAAVVARWQEGPLWLALGQGTALGTVAAVPRGTGLYVRSMAVLPSARGLGIGGALLAAVDSYARSQGADSLVLSTAPFLAAAIGLYGRSGFRPTGEGPHDLHGTPLVTMRKRLGQA